MEWIYTQTKMNSPDSLELALIMKKKEERKIDKWPIFLTSGSDVYNFFDE